MVSPALSPEPENVEEVIEVGTDEEDLSDTSSINTDTTSVASSVFHYEYENGRRYHNFRAGKYMLPNDEDEQDREFEGDVTGKEDTD